LLDARLCVATLAKAMGMKAAAIRRVFFLPTRDKLAEVFHRNLTAEHEPLTQLQPA
jgi:hypothetical protein